MTLTLGADAFMMKHEVGVGLGDFNSNPCKVILKYVFGVCHTKDKCVINHPAKFEWQKTAQL